MKVRKSTYIAYISLLLVVLVYLTIVINSPAQGKEKDLEPAARANTALSTPYTIVTTVSMLADTTRNIVGEYATVHELMGPGVDPHLYIPARSDILHISDADLVFYIGVLLEGQLSNALDSLHLSGRHVYPLIETIDDSLLIFPSKAQHADPHVWMDVTLWIQVTDAITEYLIAFDPARAHYYTENNIAYKQKLEELDAFAHAALATVPVRTLITAHDAFNYFGKAYNINVIGIQGISTESEAGISEINSLINLIIQNNIPAIFFESTVSDKYIRALIEGTARQGFTLSNGGELYSDAPGAFGTKEGSYMGMLESNIRRITIGLGGYIPAPIGE